MIPFSVDNLVQQISSSREEDSPSTRHGALRIEHRKDDPPLSLPNVFIHVQ